MSWQLFFLKVCLNPIHQTRRRATSPNTCCQDAHRSSSEASEKSFDTLGPDLALSPIAGVGLWLWVPSCPGEHQNGRQMDAHSPQICYSRLWSTPEKLWNLGRLQPWKVLGSTPWAFPRVLAIHTMPLTRFAWNWATLHRDQVLACAASALPWLQQWE